MKNLLLALCFAALSPFAVAVDISVGGTMLSIPAPDGFSVVTAEMKPYVEFSRHMVPSSNEQFVQFLSAADAALAATGKMPEPERRFYIQTSKALIQPFVANADYVQLMRTIKSQNQEISKEIEAQIPGLLQEVNKNIAADTRVDPGIAMTQMRPLPPHYETERALAYSMILKYSVNDKNGTPVPFEGVVTATFVHLRGKVLFLYVNAEKAGLEWSRVEARKWADAIIAANPSVGEIAAREARAPKSGIDWGSVGTSAIIGGIIGAVIMAIKWLVNRIKG